MIIVVFIFYYINNEKNHFDSQIQNIDIYLYLTIEI